MTLTQTHVSVESWPLGVMCPRPVCLAELQEHFLLACREDGQNEGQGLGLHRTDSLSKTGSFNISSFFLEVEPPLALMHHLRSVHSPTTMLGWG